jgi:predicted anti-sigma-YlaC factor YlaD
MRVRIAENMTWACSTMDEVNIVVDLQRYLQWRFRYMAWRTGVALVLLGVAAPVGFAMSAAKGDWLNEALSLGVAGCVILLLAWPAVGRRVWSGQDDPAHPRSRKRQPPWAHS